MTFRDFINESAAADQKDVQATLRKLPVKVRRLIAGYRFVFQNGHTMKGDKGHVGLIDDGKKQVILAAPYNYGREFVLLHEVGHLVWSRILTDTDRKSWDAIAKAYKAKLKDNTEEIFCMIFANHFCKNPVVRFDIPSLRSAMLKRLGSH